MLISELILVVWMQRYYSNNCKYVMILYLKEMISYLKEMTIKLHVLAG